MEQAHSKSLSALQPFLHLAVTTKSPSHRFLADLITRATSAPGTYVFTELLQLPSIQSLRAANTPPESQAYLTILELFSWGTYAEYNDTSNLPPLSEAQTLKLRQLSLLSLASPFLPTTTTTTDLSYASLISALSLPDAASLESLVTSSIYAGLLTARLSPTSDPPTVHITSVAPLRDLRPQSLPALLQILSTWNSRCDAVITDLEAQITDIRTTARTRNTQRQKRQEVIDNAVLNINQPSIPFDDQDAEFGGRAGLRPRGGGRLGSKRDLEEHEFNDLSDDDGGRMDIDEGLGSDSAIVGSGGGGGPGMASLRGNKRNRGRG